MTSFQVLTSSVSDQWFTPPEIIEMARSVLGLIELDPASNSIAQQWIRANRYFTAEDDGLIQDWDAKTIWLNPPYGNLGGKFCAKLLSEYQKYRFNAIVLVRGDSQAMERLFDVAYHCRSKRIKFLPSPELEVELKAKASAKGKEWKNSPVPGSTIFFLGEQWRSELFVQTFAKQGKIFAPSIFIAA